jgi:hypothetical protein
MGIPKAAWFLTDAQFDVILPFRVIAKGTV